MDPLDILMNKQHIQPYYQPIFSADQQIVIGYEVLARIKTKDGMKSLDSFFHDKSIPDEYRFEINDHIHTLALDAYMKEAKDQLLFLNYDVHLLVNDNGETFLAKLQSYREQGLRFDQLVIEITEHNYQEDLTRLKHLLTYFQSLGVKVAIDDVGRSGTNLDRIAFLKPNIVKVDLEFLGGDAFPPLYRDVLYSLSLLTKKIGAALLFERIDNFNQLNYAWKNGGRYYQGFYLAAPKPTFIDKDYSKEKLKKEFHHFIYVERQKIKAQLSLTDELSRQLKTIVKKEKQGFDYDEMILHIGKELTDKCFRVYICDQDGFQQSANAIKNDDEQWTLHFEERLKNWSWRPYFLENIVRMNYEQRGILSDLYTDIEKDEVIRTYSFPIDNNMYLFIDIPYDYLFEQDGLL